jgi:hypothetical protein
MRDGLAAGTRLLPRRPQCGWVVRRRLWYKVSFSGMTRSARPRLVAFSPAPSRNRPLYTPRMPPDMFPVYRPICSLHIERALPRRLHDPRSLFPAPHSPPRGLSLLDRQPLGRLPLLPVP